MKMIFEKRLAFPCVLAMAFLLTGCFPKAPPAISNLDKSAGTVTVQAEPGVEWDPIQNEANRGCKMFGGRAVSLSHRCGFQQGYVCRYYEYLFACEEDLQAKKARVEETCAQLALGSKEQWNDEADETYDECMMRMMTGS